jgi:hypothetical protein
MPDRNTAMENKKFYDNVMDAFYSSNAFSEALEDYLDNNWDDLVEEYWDHEI